MKKKVDRLEKLVAGLRKDIKSLSAELKEVKSVRVFFVGVYLNF